ncbi:MAG: enoyl-CoA hydratase/isomerase family protein [Halobacteriota archaeon]
MIRTRDEGPIRVVTLDRPDRRNALTRDGLDALARAVDTTDAAVVYLEGAGTAFCAGADLDVMRSLDGDDAAAFADRGQRTMNAIETADAVVLAGIDGPARGGGVELALAADVRVATPDATFAEPGVSLGVFGAWGGTRRLLEAVGESHATDLSYSGRTVDASEALAMGLVSRIVDDPYTVAVEISANDPDALRELKGLLAAPRPHREQERHEREAFERLLEDGLE